MDATEAIPILNSAIAELESMEPAWSNCRACPHSGKCCDNAFIHLVFPEEAATIASYLKAHPQKLAYARERASRSKSCYFHDPKSSECLIHDVRPVLCRWTPYTSHTSPDGSLGGFIRDENCNFTKISPRDSVVGLKPGMVEVYPKQGSVASQKMLHLQSMVPLHPLLRRVSECIDMNAVLSLTNV